MKPKASIMNQHNRHQHNNRPHHAGTAPGRGGHHGHHPEFDGPPEFGGPPHPGGRGFGGGHPGERGGRARRGEARHLLLDALRDGPKHGYEIIKALELRSGGQYAPSPGTIYPTLQFLEDASLIRAEQQNERESLRTDRDRAGRTGSPRRRNCRILVAAGGADAFARQSDGNSLFAGRDGRVDANGAGRRSRSAKARRPANHSSGSRSRRAVPQ